MTDENIQGEIDAVLGCADALEAFLDSGVPDDLVKGIEYSIILLRMTAESFRLEHL